MMPLEPERTYLSLDGQGQARTHAAEGFRQTADTSAGLVVAGFACSEDWPRWAMHPAGEEVILCGTAA